MKKKRTISPEHLAKMQEGRRIAQKRRERQKDINEINERIHNAQIQDRMNEKIIKKRIKKRR